MLACPLAKNYFVFGLRHAEDSHVKLPLQTTIFTKDGGGKAAQIATSHYLGPGNLICIEHDFDCC
jgi:hypothetical protein